MSTTFFKKSIIRVHLWGWNFTPKWLPTITTLLLLPLLMSLGFWQLDRAEQKRALQHDFASRPLAQPLGLADLQKDKDIRYYAITLRGHYSNQIILLDNKIIKGKVGFDVLTPFVPINSSKSILINRGWIPRGQNRQDMPTIPDVEGQQTINGVIYVPPKRMLTLTQQTFEQPAPNIMITQTPNIPLLANKLKHRLYPVIVLLSPKAENGFVREWNPVTITPYKHLGYAVQWFALAATLLLLYLYVTIRRQNERKNS